MADIKEIRYINRKKKEEISFKGRLVGMVTRREAEAVLNTKGAAKAVFTSASIEPVSVQCNNTRLIFASTQLKKNKRVIIITPEILFTTIHYKAKETVFCYKTVCGDEYHIVT